MGQCHHTCSYTPTDTHTHTQTRTHTHTPTDAHTHTHTRARTHTHRRAHTHRRTHTHTDNNNDDGDMSRSAFRIIMHVLSGTHFKIFFFACISVYSFSQPSTSYAPAASLGVRIKYSPSTSRKESSHFRQESHEIFLSL